METESQFEDVRKLLALKKYEQPPPGYFQDFSSRIIARIEALQARPVTWRQRLGLDFDFKPAMVGVFGVVVCGLLLVGIFASSGVTQPSNPGVALAGDPSALFASPTTDPAFGGGMGVNRALKTDEFQASTEPVGSSASGSPFGQLIPRTERATFTFGGSN